MLDQIKVLQHWHPQIFVPSAGPVSKIDFFRCWMNWPLELFLLQLILQNWDNFSQINDNKNVINYVWILHCPFFIFQRTVHCSRIKIEIKIVFWNVETHLALYFFTYVARTWLLNVPKARKVALRNVAFYCWLNVRLRHFFCPKSQWMAWSTAKRCALMNVQLLLLSLALNEHHFVVEF